MGRDLTVATYYLADVLSATDAYAYGWEMPGRNFPGDISPEYGHNGMRKSPEIGSGHHTTYFRELDGRMGRWWSADPITFPHQSPYNTFDGNPIYYTDASGASVSYPEKEESYKATVSTEISSTSFARSYVAEVYVMMGNNPVMFSDVLRDSSITVNENGEYVRMDTEEGITPHLIIEHSRTGDVKNVVFNDPTYDFHLLNGMVEHWKWKHEFNESKIFKSPEGLKLVYFMSDTDIDKTMKEENISWTPQFRREYFVWRESNAGNMDFSVNGGISRRMREHNLFYKKVLVPGLGLDALGVCNCKGTASPVIIFGDEWKRAYNWADAGNWLWGNAVNRLGGSSGNARAWSQYNDPNDPWADQSAIQNGWWYHEGYRYYPMVKPFPFGGGFGQPNTRSKP